MEEFKLPGDCSEFVQTWARRGYEFCILPEFRLPDYSDVAWRSDLPVAAVAFGVNNVGLRAKHAFAINVSAQRMALKKGQLRPLQELEAYQFLKGFDTLRFEYAEAASFVFAIDPTVAHVESHALGDEVPVGALEGARFLTTTGWLGFGKTKTPHSSTVTQVTCEGDNEPVDVLTCETLVPALTRTFKFRSFWPKPTALDR